MSKTSDLFPECKTCSRSVEECPNINFSKPEHCTNYAPVSLAEEKSEIAKNTEKHILYLFEDSTSGYDFTQHVVEALNPNTTSYFVICGGCKNVNGFLRNYLSPSVSFEILKQYYDTKITKCIPALNQISDIVLIQDRNTVVGGEDAYIAAAKTLDVNIFTTNYFCFESCLYHYSTITAHTTRDAKYNCWFDMIQTALSCYNIDNRKGLLAINQVFKFYQHRFYEKYSQPYRKSFEQLVSKVYYNAYINLKCVAVAKDNYTSLEGLKATDTLMLYFRGCCTGQNSKLKPYCDYKRKQCLCNIAVPSNVWLDFYTNSDLSFTLTCLTDNSKLETIDSLERRV